jgi:hypothetical protein
MIYYLEPTEVDENNISHRDGVTKHPPVPLRDLSKLSLRCRERCVSIELGQKGRDLEHSAATFATFAFELDLL